MLPRARGRQGGRAAWASSPTLSCGGYVGQAFPASRQRRPREAHRQCPCANRHCRPAYLADLPIRRPCRSCRSCRQWMSSASSYLVRRFGRDPQPGFFGDRRLADAGSRPGHGQGGVRVQSCQRRDDPHRSPTNRNARWLAHEKGPPDRSDGPLHATGESGFRRGWSWPRRDDGGVPRRPRRSRGSSSSRWSARERRWSP